MPSKESLVTPKDVRHAHSSQTFVPLAEQAPSLRATLTNSGRAVLITISWRGSSDRVTRHVNLSPNNFTTTPCKQWQLILIFGIAPRQGIDR